MWGTRGNLPTGVYVVMHLLLCYLPRNTIRSIGNITCPGIKTLYPLSGLVGLRLASYTSIPLCTRVDTLACPDYIRVETVDPTNGYT